MRNFAYVGACLSQVCIMNGMSDGQSSFNTNLIGTESWLREEISNAEIFRADYTTFRRDRHARGGGVFICVKNYIACAELWVDEEFEMIAVEVKGRYSKCTWEIVGIYRPPNEDMRVIEKLAERDRLYGEHCET